MSEELNPLATLAAKYGKLTDEFVALRTERDSLKADKERLDWLDSLVADIDKWDGGLLWKIQFEYPEITRDGEETLRDAIDAARARRAEPNEAGL